MLHTCASEKHQVRILTHKYCNAGMSMGSKHTIGTAGYGSWWERQSIGPRNAGSRIKNFRTTAPLNLKCKSLVKNVKVICRVHIKLTTKTKYDQNRTEIQITGDLTIWISKYVYIMWPFEENEHEDEDLFMTVAGFLLLVSRLSKEIQRKQEALLGHDDAE